MPVLSAPTEWLAERLDATPLKNGKNRPVMIECSPKNANGPSALFVVKAFGAPDVEPLTAFREVLGSVIARALGVHVPEPALVDVDETFVHATENLPVLNDRRLNPGICFGSRFVAPGMYPPTAETKFDTPELIESAVRIFGFDLTFQNNDRGPDNPNCGIHEGRVIGFDFERSFEFTGWRKDSDNVSPCWPNRLWIARRHIFRPVAHRNRAVLGSFVNDMRSFSAASVENAMAWMPSAWHLHARIIVKHVQAIQDSFAMFEQNLLGAAA